MCSRLNCRFVHLTEDDKVEVCDQRVAVCRDHANGQCRRKLCKYYHIPVVLPPANIMATIFNQQPLQQPLQHQQQLATTSTITSIEQQQKQQQQLQQEQLQQQKHQISITTITTRATPATYTSLSNHNNNNNLVNNFNNNLLYNNNIESNNNTLTSQHQHCIISPPLPPKLLSTTNSPSITQVKTPAVSSSATTSNLTALTTSTTAIPTPMATTATNLSTVAIAAASCTPTFQHLLKAQPLLAPNLAYYDLTNSGLGDFNANCLPLLSANSTYAAAPILYSSAARQQHHPHRQQNPQLTASGRGSGGIIKNIQLGTAIGQQVASNVANLPAIATTST